MNAPTSVSSPSFLSRLLSAPSTWKSLGVGALAGGAAFVGSEILYRALDHETADAARVVISTALWVAVIGLILGVALLAYDNASTLRGKWHRDLAPGAPLFALLGVVSGVAAQLLYSAGNSLVFGESGGFQFGMGARELVLASGIRALGWAILGAGVGASMGLLRSDRGQIVRGLLGGTLGGFIGGAIFNLVAVVLGPTVTDAVPRGIGVVLLGLFLGGALRLVQEVFKSAWLLGISTGPYEGKEYPLGKARLSVGRASNCDLSLFRDETLQAQVGALVFQNGEWHWQGEAIAINGVLQTNAPLEPGARLQIGQTLFRFNDRSKSAPRVAPLAFPTGAPQSGASAQPVSLAVGAPAVAVVVAAPVPAVAWTASPAVGNALVGWRFEANRASATIGRAGENDWTIKDDGTSSRHARLERTANGICITDLGSTNGTWVNEQKIVPGVPLELRGGETLRIGRTNWKIARQS